MADCPILLYLNGTIQSHPAAAFVFLEVLFTRTCYSIQNLKYEILNFPYWIKYGRQSAVPLVTSSGSTATISRHPPGCLKRDALNSHMHPAPLPPNFLPRWFAPPHTPMRASRRSGPRWSRTGTPCWPVVNCRAGGGPSRRFGCGVWSRRTSSAISRITPVSETLYPASRRGSPKEPSPQAWLLTCFSKPSHHRHSNQWDCTFGEGWMLIRATRCQGNRDRVRISDLDSSSLCSFYT